jgi:hypothetical protein
MSMADANAVEFTADHQAGDHAHEVHDPLRYSTVEKSVLLTVLFFIAAVALAVSTWGLPALSMIALALVPVVYVVLLLITVGR